AEGTANARASIADINATLQQTSGRLDSAGQQTGDAIQAGAAAIEQVQGLLNDSALSPELAAPLEETLQRLEAGNAASERLLDDVTGLNADAAATVDSVSAAADAIDRKSTRLNSSHVSISYAVFCLKKKTKQT